MTTALNGIKYLSWGERRELLTQLNAAEAELNGRISKINSRLSLARTGFKNAAANDARNRINLGLTVDHSNVLAAYQAKGQALKNELTQCNLALKEIKTKRGQISGWFLWIPRISTIAKEMFKALAALGIGAGTAYALREAVNHASLMA